MTAREIRTVLVVGAGAIGTSWAAHLLNHGLTVVVSDPDASVHERGRARVLTFLAETAGADTGDPGENLRFETDLATAAQGVDLVIESGPERLDVKRDIFQVLDDALPADVLLTTSSSGLMISDVADGCTHPERILVAHPFNPPHLVPLVEIVAGKATSAQAMDAADAFFTGVDKKTIRVSHELPGHVVNRLQAALWREAYHLVDIGAVSVADIDTAIAWGPGLRWSLLGPFATQHISGGGLGIGHVLEHLGPPMVEWWKHLGSPELTPELVDSIVTGVADELGDTDEDHLRARRDQTLLALIQLKQSAGMP